MQTLLQDSGGRRSGMDRREFTYTFHIPERRRGLDRRSGFDRRNKLNQRSTPFGRRFMDRECSLRIFYESLSIRDRYS